MSVLRVRKEWVRQFKLEPFLVQSTDVVLEEEIDHEGSSRLWYAKKRIPKGWLPVVAKASKQDSLEKVVEGVLDEGPPRIDPQVSDILFPGSVFFERGLNERETALEICLAHLREVQAMARVSANEVVALRGYVPDKNMILMESLGPKRGWQNFPQEYHSLESLSDDDCLSIMLSLCYGLSAVHQRRILHRDIKEENVKIRKIRGSWETKLIDFGSAISYIRYPDMKSNRHLRGRTWGYSPWQSPLEQFFPIGIYSDRRPTQDYRADQYALGILFATLIQNMNPYINMAWKTNPQTRLTDQEYVDITTAILLGNRHFCFDDTRVRSRLSPLGEIVRPALHPNPANRYKSTRYFLERMVAGIKELQREVDARGFKSNPRYSTQIHSP